MTERILPMEEMEERAVYRIYARNFFVGVWNPATKGLIGIRTKFGDQYLFTEYHYDADPHVGTARPLEKVGTIPADVPLREYDETEDGNLRRNQPLFDALKPYADAEFERWQKENKS